VNSGQADAAADNVTDVSSAECPERRTQALQARIMRAPVRLYTSPFLLDATAALPLT